PLVVQIVAPGTETSGRSALLTLASICLVLLVSFIVPYGGQWISNILMFTGYIFFVIALLVLLKSNKLVASLILFLFAGLFGVWLFGRVYSSYHSPLALENLTFGGISHDTFYNSSVMEMIKTFGIPSTGLNGTPYLPYHWGSHWILSRFSILLDASSIEIYNLVYPSLFLCLFLKGLLGFAYDLFLLTTKRDNANIRPGITFWVVFFVFNIGFLPSAFLANWANWEQWVESESYSIGMLCFFLLASLTLYLFSKSKEHQSLKFNRVYFFPLAALVPLLGLMKISVLVIAIAVLIYLVFKLRFFKDWVILVTVVLTLALSFFVLRITASTYISNDENDNFFLFHFLKTWTLKDWRGLFYYIHYFYTILYIVLRIRELKITLINLKEYFLTNKLLDIEILILISIVGLLPAFIFRIDGGSAYYFTDIQARISGAFLLFYILRDQFFAEKRFLQFTGRFALLVPAILLMSVSIIFTKFESAINLNLLSRIEFAQRYGGESHYAKVASADIMKYTSGKASDVWLKLKEMKWMPGQGLAVNPKYEFLMRLIALDKLDLGEKRKMLLHVPHSNQAFWKNFGANTVTTSFIIPALTGISSIGGMPESIDESLYLNYGFHTYRDKFREYSYKQPAIDSLCSYRVDQTPKTILVLNSSLVFDTLLCE
ncbi:MAG TPA: hypothetical protein PKN99_09660, partial [Cyclobacteriaceae bacterium]|nr:hypothetical protein [Cyclobacteriaceae bacterium]